MTSALKSLLAGFQFSLLLLVLCSYINTKRKSLCVSSLGQGSVLVCGTVASASVVIM